jgi:FAD/FMN-containing dehydrogenase
VWNSAIDRRPALIVRPTSTDDVVTAVRFGREQELDIAVKSGGHSIPGHSTCDGGIVIDLSGMRGAQVDPERRTAQVGGGALLAELDEAAQGFGLVCPVGVVSHTGVAGLTLGGGMGRLQRKFGLTIDNLLSVSLVTADGRVVRASEDENPELFWGLRGAGANFGIATSFEFRLHPLEGPITYGSAAFRPEQTPDVAAAFRDLSENGPDELWVSLGIGASGAQVSALHCGPVEEAKRDLAVLRALGPATDSIAATEYLSAQHANDEPMAWGHRFYMKSAFLPALPDAVVELCLEQVARAPDGSDCAVSIWAWGRAIAAVSEEETAFTGRAAGYWFSAEAVWEDPALDEGCRAWGKAILADVKPFAMEGRYVNDVAEAQEDLRSVYGDAKYERLVALKRAWDPDNLFRLNQNVRP